MEYEADQEIDPTREGMKMTVPPKSEPLCMIEHIDLLQTEFLQLKDVINIQNKRIHKLEKLVGV